MATLKQQVEDLKKRNAELESEIEALTTSLDKANKKARKFESALGKSKQRSTAYAVTKPMRHV